MQNLFYYPIIVDDLSTQEKKFTIKATDVELKEIAEILKVSDVKFFESVIKLKYDRKNSHLRVCGEVKAELELQSVVSLENFTKEYSSSFELNYDTKATLKSLKEMDFDFEDEIPDIVINGQIDLAEISIEQIALIMEDYPKKEGECFKFECGFDANEDVKKNPFEVLKNLKK